MNDHDLLKYIGREWNAETKRAIELEFYPNRIKLCNALTFHRENRLNNTIRCIIINGRVFNMSFH